MSGLHKIRRLLVRSYFYSIVDMSDLIEDLRRQLIRKTADRDNVGSLGPASTVDGMVLEAEDRALGFKLPEILKRVYREIGNGGFGPGYGLIGVKGGWPDDTGRTLAEIYAIQSESALEPDDENWNWPTGLLPLCHWGCAIYSCVDCLTPENPIRIFDPSLHDADPSWRDAFFDESPSLERWLNDWANGVDLWSRSYGDNGSIAREIARRDSR